MSGRALGVVVMPHLIPAGTLANHDIDRAMEGPPALDRDEVLYMICTHPRLRAVWPDPDVREFDVLIARYAGVSDIGWDPEPWAHVTVPEHVRPASVEWAISDSALETVEGLTRTRGRVMARLRTFRSYSDGSSIGTLRRSNRRR